MRAQQSSGDAEASRVKKSVTRLATREINYLTVAYLFVIILILSVVCYDSTSVCSCGSHSSAFCIEAQVADDDGGEMQKRRGREWRGERDVRERMNHTGSSEDTVRKRTKKEDETARRESCTESLTRGASEIMIRIFFFLIWEQEYILKLT